MGTTLWAAIIIFSWCLLLVTAPIILRKPRQSGFSVAGWRVVNAAFLSCPVLLATAATMAFLFEDERFHPFGMSTTILIVAIAGFGALAWLCVIGASIVLHTAEHPEIAVILHMPARLYAWLYDDHDETPQLVLEPGDHS